jgi:hypothetical protein
VRYHARAGVHNKAECYLPHRRNLRVVRCRYAQPIGCSINDANNDTVGFADTLPVISANPFTNINTVIGANTSPIIGDVDHIVVDVVVDNNNQ